MNYIFQNVSNAQNAREMHKLNINITWNLISQYAWYAGMLVCMGGGASTYEIDPAMLGMLVCLRSSTSIVSKLLWYGDFIRPIMCVRVCVVCWYARDI